MDVSHMTADMKLVYSLRMTLVKLKVEGLTDTQAKVEGIMCKLLKTRNERLGLLYPFHHHPSYPIK